MIVLTRPVHRCVYNSGELIQDIPGVHPCRCLLLGMDGHDIPRIGLQVQRRIREQGTAVENRRDCLAHQHLLLLSRKTRAHCRPEKSTADCVLSWSYQLTMSLFFIRSIILELTPLCEE